MKFIDESVETHDLREKISDHLRGNVKEYTSTLIIALANSVKWPVVPIH